jgi:hypothetical protein
MLRSANVLACAGRFEEFANTLLLGTSVHTVDSTAGAQLVHTYIHTYIEVCVPGTYRSTGTGTQDDFVAVQFILSTFLVSRSLDRSKITQLFYEKRGKKEAIKMGRRRRVRWEGGGYVLILAVENGCEKAQSTPGPAHGCAIQTIFEYGSGKGTIVKTTHSIMKGAFNRIFGVCRPEFCLCS